MSRLLGIDENWGLVYEGSSRDGVHVVWPTPVITPAKLVDATAKEFAATHSGQADYYFREETFDPVSRIRRGRFYKFAGRSGSGWWALPSHQITIPRSQTNSDGLLGVSASEYQSCALSAELSSPSIQHSIVVLGKEKSSTIWRIIHIETSFSGEELVTLKARQSMGALPLVNWNKVPADAVSMVREKLDVLEDDYHRAGAESVVDRAREAATAILSGYLQQDYPEAKGSDLGVLVKLLGKKNDEHSQRIVACAAEIPQRLHSRGKTAEQEKRGVRSIREQDAELAVQCIGVMLCDLGWASWR